MYHHGLTPKETITLINIQMQNGYGLNSAVNGIQQSTTNTNKHKCLNVSKPQYVITGQVPLVKDSSEHMAPPYAIQTAIAKKLHQGTELTEAGKKS